METPRELLVEIAALKRRYARRVGEDAAAELAAEALVRALERPPADGRFGGWLSRIMRNLVVDRWRRAERARRGRALLAPAEGPEELALAGERRREVRRALAAMPRPVRREILGRYWRDDPAAGPASRTRVHRGLRRMRELLQGLRAFLPVGPAVAPAAAVVFLMAQLPVVPPAAPAPTRPAVVVVHRAPPPPVPSPAPPRVQRFDFDDDAVTGDLRRPDEVLIDATVSIKHPSLIEIPASMLPALVRSVEDL